MDDPPGEPTENGRPRFESSDVIGDQISTQEWEPQPSTGSLTWHGFPDTPMPQVGAVWGDPPGDLEEGVVQYCSGTVVSRALVLTAAHCLYSQRDGQFYGDISFVPGQTWNNTQSTDPLDISAPAGVWAASQWWVPEGYRDGTVDLDWGLIEIEPQNGRYIGDAVGAFAIQTGITFREGAHIWAAGYPRSGWWATPEGRLGRGQYSCDTTWDGSWKTHENGEGVELWIRCPMNGGASGGPWFVALNSGQWVVGGVNNWCNDDFKDDDESPEAYCTPVSEDLRSLAVDSRFLEFWNSVQPLLTL
ncbi:MAG: trypsin-like peptidase domain-containing protein [Chloroflexota bacterium]